MSGQPNLTPTVFADGSALTWGVPGVDENTFQRWLGPRWAWWPSGIPAGRRIGLASSRVGRKLETRATWFTVLRAACAKIDPVNELLVSTAETTSAPFVERAAALFGLRRIHIEVAPDNLEVAAWWRKMRTKHPSAPAVDVFPVFLSPEVETVNQGESTVEPLPPNLRDAPSRDRALVAISDQLLVSHVRPNGHHHQLLRLRLGDSAWPLASVQVAVGDDLLTGNLRDELLDMGAVGWYLYGAAPTDNRQNTVENPRTVAPRPNAIISLPDPQAWPYLTHCTRQRHGAWPDETENEYLDSLLVPQTAADRSAFAALRRIVQMQRLLATPAANRGGHPVVSFTAVPVAELMPLRTFRPHRGRWDFEPYGICIRRDWLAASPCRAVRYGNDALWNSLTADERPFFQVATSGRGKNKIYWTLEKEWRHLGDVDLAPLPSESAFLFVPTHAEAMQLAKISRWPVAIVPSAG